MSAARQAQPALADTPPVEREVVVDMIRRSLPALPVVVLVGGLIWGVDGAFSAMLAIGLVLLNFLMSAAILSWAARISLAFLMGAALLGFVARAAFVTIAVVLVKDLAWVKLMPLAVMLLVTHLGLLIWETKHVSASLAFPSILPKREVAN